METDASTPLVWAVVLFHGGEEITAACVDSLLASDYPALRILLVDNASPDGAGEPLRRRYPMVAHLDTGANLGYAGGNNRGIAWALAHGAEFILVINNDTVVEPACVSHLVRTAQGVERLGLVAPKILYHDLPNRIWFAGGRLSRTRALGMHLGEMQIDDPGEPPRADRITFATGCCFLMPALTAREVPMFDERFFMYCEDVELSYRLNQGGYQLLYQPAARLYHRETSWKSRPSPFKLRQRDRNRRLLVATHYGLADRVRFMAFFYPSRGVHLLRHLVRLEWPQVKAIFDGAFR